MGSNAAQELNGTNKVLQAVFDSAPNGIAVMQAIYDEAGKAEDFTILLFNSYTLNWIGDIDYKGKRYGDVFPMVKETGILERFQQVAETGVTANFERFYNGEGMNHWFRFTAVRQGEFLVVTTEDITDAKNAEAALSHAALSSQKQQRLYEAVTNNTPDLVYVFDLDYRFTYANKALLAMWGRSWEESIGKGLRDLGYEEWHAQMHEREIDEVAATKKTIRGTVSFPHAELGKRIYDYIFAPVFNETGEVEAIAGTTRDITDIKKTEEAIRESESRFRLMADTIPEIIWVTDAQGQSEFFNKRWEEFSGVPIESAMAEAVADRFIHPDDAPATMAAFTKSIRTGQPMEVEQRNRAASGEWRWFLNRAKPYRNPQTGQVEKWFGIGTDIHEQKQMQQALAESEARFRTMVEQAQVPIGMTRGREMVFEAINAPMLELINKAGTNVLQKTVEAVLPELEGQAMMDILHTVWDSGQPFMGQEVPATLLVNGEPEQKYYNLSYTPVASGGKMEYIIHLAVDVTEQVVARQKLEEKEKALEAALDQVRLSKEAAELGTFDMDLIKGTMHWDERCRELFGISHHGPVTYEKDFVGGLHPDDRERITTLIDNLFIKSISDGNYDVEYRTIGQRDGVVRWVRAKGKVYFNGEDKPVRFIGSVLDITEQVSSIQEIERTVEERTRELAQANGALQRINKELQRSNANLEEFAHAASHDLKEPTRKIGFFTQQLKTQLGDRLSEKETFSISRIENASQRMANLIDDLLLYSHVSQRPHQMEDVDLNERVQYVLEDLELDIHEKDAVIHAAQLPVVRGYTRQLQQLFQNLVSNALKYSKAGVPPRIDITAGEVSEDGKHYHRIEVKDNGIGFEPEYADKIFQMFARLHGRSAYSGTGIGLSIVKKVVEHHNGFIRVDSMVGEGSVFKIYLPV